MKVIIVEDDSQNLDLLEIMLKSSGYEVVTASDGAEALQKMRTEKFDTIISDIMMPVMDGFQLCRECKSDEALRNIPFVFYTATYGEKKDEELALKLGADRFLRKPMESVKFIETLVSIEKDIGIYETHDKVPDTIDAAETYKLYSERLVNKLEKRKQDLEKEVAERKKAEDLFSNLTLSAPVGIYIVQGGKFQFTNPQFQKDTGYAMNELLGIDSLSIVIPDDRKVVRENAVKMLKRERSEQYEYRILTKSGDIRWFLEIVSPIEYGGVNASLGCTMDITARKQVERAQCESEERFRSIFDHSLDGILVIDPETNGIYASNKAISRMLGYSLEEISNLKFADIHPGVNLAKITERIEKEWRNERRQARAVPLRKKDGKIIYAEVTPSLITFAGKKCLAGIFRDITERQQFEAKLKENENKFRELFNNMGDGVAVCRAINGGEDFIIVDFNNTAERIDQMSREKVIGKLITEIFPGVKEIGLLDIYRRVWKTGKPERLTPMLYQDNRVSGWRDGYTYKLPTDEIVIVYQDIGEKKQAEQRIKIFSDAIAGASDGIVITDAKGIITYTNPALEQMYGYQPGELLGKSVLCLNHNPPTTKEIIASMLKTGRWNGETESIKKNGERFISMLALSTLKDDQNNIIATMAVARDVTEKKKMQEQLILTDRLASIGQLASGIAHELNNPLTSIIGFSEMLLNRKDLADDIEEDLKIVYDEARRTSQVVKGLLAFARKETAKKENIDIRNILQGVLQLRGYEQRVNNIEVKTHFASGLPRVKANIAQMQQVMFNIIINAEQAMLSTHGKGTLTVDIRQTGNIVKITISDDGPGISLENMKKLFTPFFTTKEVGKGTGLGLSICHGIIIEHHGRIYAQSEPGKGATFVIELPVAE